MFLQLRSSEEFEKIFVKQVQKRENPCEVNTAANYQKN